MAKSKFEYVKQFETEDKLLPNCWIVVRIDGKGFHRFSEVHNYLKPNDDRALDLMSKAAETVMEEFKDVILGYGQSDEYSFVFKKNTNVYNRRASKLATNIVSLFASSFVYFWPRYFGTQMMQYPPAFDSRTVLYPSDKNLRDYLSWRQADCHINNLYNTCFWTLIQEKGLSPAESQDRLKFDTIFNTISVISQWPVHLTICFLAFSRLYILITIFFPNKWILFHRLLGTMSSDKNELLYKEFDVNYNSLHPLYRKGTILVRTPKEVPNGDLDLTLQLNLSGTGSSGGSFGSSTARSPVSARSGRGARKFGKPNITRLHTDLIGQQFWTDYPEILEPTKN